MMELYPFQKLDKLIMETLFGQPRKKLNESSESFRPLPNRTNEQLQVIQNYLAHLPLQIKSHKKLKKTLQHHYDCFSSWHSLLSSQRTSESRKTSGIHPELIHVLKELILFMEYTFKNYISSQAKVSAVFLESVQQLIHVQLPEVMQKLQTEQIPEELRDLVVFRLKRFADFDFQRASVSYNATLYKKNLIEKLGDLSLDTPSECFFSPLDFVLIYLNYNSKTYCNHLCMRIHRFVQEAPETPEQLLKLEFVKKTFFQLQKREDLILNPNYFGLRELIENWFLQETKFLNKKLQGIQAREESFTKLLPVDKKAERKKIKFNLSADQLALFLRAMQETRLLAGPSRRQVYHRIVPFLSSANREVLSSESLRSKSYAMETKDKEKVISTLDNLKKAIQAF